MEYQVVIRDGEHTSFEAGVQRNCISLGYAYLHVPLDIDAQTIQPHLALWYPAYDVTLPQSRRVRPDIVVTVHRDPVGTMGRLWTDNDGRVRAPIMWEAHAGWRRNLWYLSHECAELLLKLELRCPRWFVEGFAQLSAFRILERIPDGSPLVRP